MSHGGGEEENLEANAWPGFVDILSSVMIMFVFFLMITATALYFHTIKFKSEVLSNNAKVVADQVDEKVKDLVIENQILKDQIQQMMQSNASPIESKDKVLQQSAEFVASKNQTTDTLDQDNTLVVFFGEDAISLTKETTDIIKDFMDRHKASAKTITLVSNMQKVNEIELTARKVAVARMLNVRNGVLQSKISSSKIKASIVKSDDINSKSDWVKIVVGN